MNESNTSNRKPLLIGGVVVSAVLIIGVYTLFLKKSDSPTVASSTNNTSQTVVKSAETAQSERSTQPTVPETTDAATTSSSIYKNGTYTKTVDYRVPEGGTNQLTASITVKGDTITTVTSSTKYEERDSKRYVDGFDKAIGGTVSGKKLSDTHIGRVGGASLTSAAFNSIIEAVMTDAKA